MFTIKPAFTQVNLRQSDNGNQSPWKTQPKHHGHSVNSHMVSMDFHWNGHVLPCPIWTDDPNFQVFFLNKLDIARNAGWLHCQNIMTGQRFWMGQSENRSGIVEKKQEPFSTWPTWPKQRNTRIPPIPSNSKLCHLTPSRVGGQNRQFQHVSTILHGELTDLFPMLTCSSHFQE